MYIFHHNNQTTRTVLPKLFLSATVFYEVIKKNFCPGFSSPPPPRDSSIVDHAKTLARYCKNKLVISVKLSKERKKEIKQSKETKKETKNNILHGKHSIRNNPIK